MMSVLEYANDVNLTVDQIIKICNSLNIKVCCASTSAAVSSSW